jgi:hypothetical protein
VSPYVTGWRTRRPGAISNHRGSRHSIHGPDRTERGCLSQSQFKILSFADCVNCPCLYDIQQTHMFSNRGVRGAPRIGGGPDLLPTYSLARAGWRPPVRYRTHRCGRRDPLTLRGLPRWDKMLLAAVIVLLVITVLPTSNQELSSSSWCIVRIPLFRSDWEGNERRMPLVWEGTKSVGSSGGRRRRGLAGIKRKLASGAFGQEPHGTSRSVYWQGHDGTIVWQDQSNDDHNHHCNNHSNHNDTDNQKNKNNNDDHNNKDAERIVEACARQGTPVVPRRSDPPPPIPVHVTPTPSMVPLQRERTVEFLEEALQLQTQQTDDYRARIGQLQQQLQQQQTNSTELATNHARELERLRSRLARELASTLDRERTQWEAQIQSIVEDERRSAGEAQSHALSVLHTRYQTLQSRHQALCDAHTALLRGVRKVASTTNCQTTTTTTTTSSSGIVNDTELDTDSTDSSAQSVANSNPWDAPVRDALAQLDETTTRHRETVAFLRNQREQLLATVPTRTDPPPTDHRVSPGSRPLAPSPATTRSPPRDTSARDSLSEHSLGSVRRLTWTEAAPPTTDPSKKASPWNCPRSLTLTRVPRPVRRVDTLCSLGSPTRSRKAVPVGTRRRGPPRTPVARHPRIRIHTPESTASSQSESEWL